MNRDNIIKQTISISIALYFLLVGCDSKKEEKDKPESPKGEVKIELELKKDADWGYQIKIPKGAKTLQNTDLMQTYSRVLSDGMVEINVNLAKVGASSLDQAVRDATMMGQKKIEKKETREGGGYVVIKEPQGIVQEAWVFLEGKKGPVRLKCSSPVEHKDLMMEIVRSFAVEK